MRIGSAFYFEGNIPNWRATVKRFDFFIKRLLANVGMKAARSLYDEKLTKILRPRSFSSTHAPLSKSGKRMVSYSVNTLRDSVIIRSYPLNVYRTGPGPRTEKRTEGEKILRSFKGSFNAQAAAIDVFEKLVKDKKDGLFTESETSGWSTRLRRSESNRAGAI